MYTLYAGGMSMDYKSLDDAINDAHDEYRFSNFEIVDEDSGERVYIEHPAQVL